mmetsp:Transcript_37529/g.58612  ORF Transcript_37529/g.58612 Transcript_37529/m.58612 type:complete len:203 (+) Transcript_37529:320-928(+)
MTRLCAICGNWAITQRCSVDNSFHCFLTPGYVAGMQWHGRDSNHLLLTLPFPLGLTKAPTSFFADLHPSVAWYWLIASLLLTFSAANEASCSSGVAPKREKFDIDASLSGDSLSWHVKKERSEICDTAPTMPLSLGPLIPSCSSHRTVILVADERYGAYIGCPFGLLDKEASSGCTSLKLAFLAPPSLLSLLSNKVLSLFDA